MEFLDLSGQRFSAEDLGVRLNRSKPARLVLNNSAISLPGANVIAEVLRDNSFLVSLDLVNNKIESEGACKIADALMHNTSLVELNILQNKIGNVGIVAFCRALKHNNSLRVLQIDLFHAAVALCEALSVNITLEKLVLGGNGLWNNEVKAICETVERHNTTLEVVKFPWYGIDLDLLSTLGRHLDRNKKMHQKARRAGLCVLAIYRWRRSLLSALPRNLALKLAIFLWDTRGNYAWGNLY